EHLAENPIVEAEPAQQHVAARDLEQLRRGERFDQLGGILGDAETEQRRGLVVLDHPLREEQVGEVRFPDFVQQLRVVHFGSPSFLGYTARLLRVAVCRRKNGGLISRLPKSRGVSGRLRVGILPTSTSGTEN